MFSGIYENFVAWIYEFIKVLDLTSPIRVVILIADILIVSLLIYYFYKMIKKNKGRSDF